MFPMWTQNINLISTKGSLCITPKSAHVAICYIIVTNFMLYKYVISMCSIRKSTSGLFFGVLSRFPYSSLLTN